MSTFKIKVDAIAPNNCDVSRIMLDEAYDQAQRCVKSYGWEAADYHLPGGTHREDELKEQLRRIESENEAAEKNEAAKGESESDVIIRDIANVLLRQIATGSDFKVKARAVATLYAFMSDNMEFLTEDDALFDYIEAKTLRFIQLTSGQVREFLRTMSTKRINSVDAEMEYATLREAFGAQAEALKQWLELANHVADANRRLENDYEKCENRLVKNKHGVYDLHTVPRGSNKPFLLDESDVYYSGDEDDDYEASEASEEERGNGVYIGANNSVGNDVEMGAHVLAREERESQVRRNTRVEKTVSEPRFTRSMAREAERQRPHPM